MTQPLQRIACGETHGEAVLDNDKFSMVFLLAAVLALVLLTWRFFDKYSEKKKNP